MEKYVRGAGFLAVTLAVYLGLPLLGWGVGDVATFFAVAPRLGYALLIVVVGLAMAYQSLLDPRGAEGRRGLKEKRVSRQTVLAAGLTLILFAALFLLPFADRRGLAVLNVGPGVRWLGLALSAAGFTLIVWSGLALGQLYSAEVTIQADHRLITTGLYRYIRHPRYLGVIFMALGAALLFRSWAGLVLSVLLPGLLLYRISDEEALMQREFGAEWDEYCRRSWRLIPHLY